jgi:hypothetical protein
MLLLILRHPLESLSLWNIDRIECIFVHVVKKRQYCQNQIRSAVDLIVLQFCLRNSKDKKVTWYQDHAIGRIRYSTSTKFCETFIRFLSVVKTSAVNMRQDSFQGKYLAMGPYVFKEIKCNDITEGCPIIYSPFCHVEQTVHSVDRPNPNQALFPCQFFVWFFLEHHVWMGLRLIDEDNRNKIKIRLRLSPAQILSFALFWEFSKGLWRMTLVRPFERDRGSAEPIANWTFSKWERRVRGASKYALQVSSRYKDSYTK